MSNSRPARKTAAKKTAARKTAVAKRASNGTVYSMAKYRSEATGEPFRLQVDDDYVIEIPRPNGETLMAIGDKFAGVDPNNPATATSVNPRELLELLLGDTYDEVMAVIGAEDIKVLVAFCRDLAEHFELGEALASLG